MLGYGIGELLGMSDGVVVGRSDRKAMGGIVLGYGIGELLGSFVGTIDVNETGSMVVATE